jgi:hypothetical protein
MTEDTAMTEGDAAAQDRAPAQNASRRAALEVATAVLLGLVSVATAAGAYQSSEWSQQSGHYASIAGQLRDASLASYVTSDLAGFDDGERMFDALAIEFEIMEGPANVEELRTQQQVILGAATEGLDDEWAAWVEGGYRDDEFPSQSVEFANRLYAPTYGANAASVVAHDAADALAGRSVQVMIASVLFALALLLLGVSGAYAALRVSFALALGGATMFLVGVVISALAVIG